MIICAASAATCGAPRARTACGTFRGLGHGGGDRGGGGCGRGVPAGRLRLGSRRGGGVVGMGGGVLRPIPPKHTRSPSEPLEPARRYEMEDVGGGWAG